MAVDQTRFFITARDNIDTNINNGTINANDFVICSDTHELVYVDNNNDYFAITTTGEGMDELVQQLEERLTEIQEAAENSIVTGVKGSNEQNYRTGNVNLGTDDFGLGNVTNHTQVRGLITGTTEDHLVSWGNNGYVVKDSGVIATNGQLIADSLKLNSSTINSDKRFIVSVDDDGSLYTISDNQEHTINRYSVPTQTSQLVNDSGFVTSNDVNLAINTAISGITGFSLQVVNNLPVTGEAGIIYLVSNVHGANDVYDEYVYYNNAFEKIGTTNVDLSNCVSTSDMVLVTEAEVDAMFV